MLADELDYVIGVDPHRDAHALAVVEVRSGGVIFETDVVANESGYRAALSLAVDCAPGRRAFAVEGSGSFGAGLTRFLTASGEQVFEVGRLRRERRSRGKTDALDAVRTARSVLGQSQPALPRAGAERDGLRALMVARESALIAKKACLCQLHALIVTCPESLRAELTTLTRARLLARCASLRPNQQKKRELRGTLVALKSLANRTQALTREERELEREISVPRLFRPDHPPPSRPRRRSSTQPSATNDRAHATPPTTGDDHLHRATPQRRENQPRGHPLPQTLPRSPPLPAPRAPTSDDLTNIEASP